MIRQGLRRRIFFYGGAGGGIFAALFLAGCASLATETLENRLQAIGVPAGTATCMATDLKGNLSTDDVIDLTRYTFTLSRVDSVAAAIDALLQIDNPRAVRAIGQAGFSCVTSGLFR